MISSNGGWVIDNFPIASTHWEALLDLPEPFALDRVIFLEDTGPDSDTLIRRYFVLHREQLEMNERERRRLAKLADIEAERLRKEEEQRQWEEEQVRLEEERSAVGILFT